MPRDPRYDILFQPVQIGPKTAPNRFFQVPHASGMTNACPRVRAAFRGMKAEGGWGVVCTGACSVHESSAMTARFRTQRCGMMPIPARMR